MEKQYRTIDNRQAVVWFIGRFIGLAVMAAAYAFYAVYALAADVGQDWHTALIALNILFIVLLCLQAVNTFVFPWLQRYFWRWRVEDDKVEIYYGVLRKVTGVAPVARIQQISLIRPLIDRIVGLSRIVITTAGSNITIIGLPKDTAQPLADTLNERVNTLARQDEGWSTL